MIVKVDYQHFLSHLNLVQFVLDREIGTELRIRVRPIIVNILPAHITCCETGFPEIYFQTIDSKAQILSLPVGGCTDKKFHVLLQIPLLWSIIRPFILNTI